MSITTKNGDGGVTTLHSGERVAKNCFEIECVGEMDELNSYLGIVKTLLTDEQAKPIEYIQKMLFIAGSDVATITKDIRRIEDKDLDELDKMRSELEEMVGPIKNFVYYGSTALSAHLDYARALSRTVERRLVSSPVRNQRILMKYFNRLSDYLYLLARKYDGNFRNYMEKT